MLPIVPLLGTKPSTSSPDSKPPVIDTVAEASVLLSISLTVKTVLMAADAAFSV